MNWQSPALLADRGFLYDSSLLDGDAPYRMAVAEGDSRDIVEIPVDWALDDWEQYGSTRESPAAGVIESPAKRWKCGPSKLRPTTPRAAASS